jgi:uncharacterized protein (DUF4415 family)
MSVRKQNSSNSPKDQDKINSDLARLDTHEITSVEYEDLPEWTDAMIEEADLYENGRLIRRGRRQVVTVSLPLSADIVAKFEATGPGWEARIDAALRDWLAQHPH